MQISVEAHKDAKDGYKLAFRFADNVYFDAEILVKQINFVTDTDSGLQTCHTTGSKPKWKQQVYFSPSAVHQCRFCSLRCPFSEIQASLESFLASNQ